MPFTGHCLCGAVTYVVNVSEPDLVAYCHCDDCQRQSGSTYCELILSLGLQSGWCFQSRLIVCSVFYNCPKRDGDYQGPDSNVYQ